MIKVMHGGDVEYGRPPQITKQERDALQSVVVNYGHVLNTSEDRNVTRTWDYFGDKIAMQYSTLVPRNAEAVRLLRALGGGYPAGPARYSGTEIRAYMKRAHETLGRLHDVNITPGTEQQQEARRALDFLARVGKPNADDQCFVSTDPHGKERARLFLSSRLGARVTFEYGETRFGPCKYLTVRRTRDGATLRTGYSEQQHGDILLNYIEAAPTGTGIGTDFFEALRQYANIIMRPVCVFQVTNWDFFDRFSWFTPDKSIAEVYYNPRQLVDN